MTEDIFGSMKCFIGLVMRYTVLEVQRAEKRQIHTQVEVL